MGCCEQWQTALLFWWGNRIFPLSTSWQSAFSLGQTNKFLYCWWENSFCKRTSASSWSRKLIPQHSLLAAGSTSKGGNHRFVCKRGNKNQGVCCRIMIFWLHYPQYCFGVLYSPRLHVYKFVMVSAHIWGSFVGRWHHLLQVWKWRCCLGHRPSPDLKQKQ